MSAAHTPGPWTWTTQEGETMKREPYIVVPTGWGQRRLMTTPWPRQYLPRVLIRFAHFARVVVP